MTVSNQTTAAAWSFHDATKMYLAAGKDPDDDGAFGLGDPSAQQPALGPQDPANEPLPYKIYPTLPAVPLPRPESTPTMSALDALIATGMEPSGQIIPDLNMIARICLRSNGLLKTWTNAKGRTWEFRAAGCTGARYHIELYVVCGTLPGLEAGVYHYDVHDHALRCLRSGDFRGAIVSATADEPAIAQVPAVVVTTSTFWRNAWRYQARAYRHVYWDTGTLLGNLLAVAADARLPARPILGFVDADVNALLDIDGEREAAIALVALGRDSAAIPESPPALPLNHPVQPISASEIEFPEIAAMHEASSLRSAAEVEAWRHPTGNIAPPSVPGEPIPLQPLSSDRLPDDGIDQVIERRRSFRRYDSAKALSFATFSSVLARSGRTVAFDCNRDGRLSLTTRVLLVNQVANLEPGVYVVNADATALTRLRAGDVSELAFELATYQTYARDAHVNVYELADLSRALSLFGNRAYRVAQLEAAIAGARLQLAAHALDMGAVGSTSLDDRVTEALSPASTSLSFMFVAVFGERARKNQPAEAAG